MLNIKPTQFTREDGVSIHRLDNDKWAIRRVGPGPTWFYCVPGQHGNNPGGWMISTVSGFDVEQYSYDFAIAMETLKTVPKR